MSKTVLKTVQDILSAMDSDEVNGIGDTIESQQVASCVEIIYNQMVAEYDLPVKTKVIKLESTDDYTNGKTRLYLPEGMLTLDHLEYDKRTTEDGIPNYGRIDIVSDNEFLDRVKNLDTSQSNIEEQYYPNTTFTFGVYNDRAPSYAMLVEQNVLVLDSYQTDIEGSLQTAKSLAKGQIADTLVLADETVLDLPPELYNTLFTNALELAYDLYKGDTPMKVKDLARNGRVRQQRAKQKLRNQSFTGPDYGRKSKYKGTLDGIDGGAVEPLPDYLKT